MRDFKLTQVLFIVLVIFLSLTVSRPVAPILTISLLTPNSNLNTPSNFTSMSTTSLSDSSTAESVDNLCEGGVCKMPSDASLVNASSNQPLNSNSKNDSNIQSIDSTNTAIGEIEKLGWSKYDAERALNSSKGDIEEAIDLLTLEDENKEKFEACVNEIVNNHQWKRHVAELALIDSNMNISRALELIEAEENTQTAIFNRSIASMVESGWDEYIARKALIAQWQLEEKKAAGYNSTMSAEELASIRPTLRRQNQTTPSTSNKTSTSLKKSKSTPRSPVKKEDCVFEVNSENFQKIVLESKVPILLDIYADWCGPCKQLTPQLESAAIKSGGMFHIAKLNADMNRDFVDIVKAEGFPTVFAVNKGRFTDRFVGLLPRESMEQFLVRAVTGFGERVQADQISQTELNDITNSVSNWAGLSSLTFKKKERLKSKIDNVLSDDSSWDSNSLSEGIKTALLYIKKASSDVRNEKYRLIKSHSKAFQDKIAKCAPAVKLLQISGFKSNDTSQSSLNLVHYNVAILNLVTQHVDELVSKKKFSSLKLNNFPSTAPSLAPTHLPTLENEFSRSSRPSSSNSKSFTDIEGMDQTIPPTEPGIVSVSMRSSLSAIPAKNVYPSSTSLEEVVRDLSKVTNSRFTLQVRHPRILKELDDSNIQGLTLRDVCNEGNELVLHVSFNSKYSGSSKKSFKRSSIVSKHKPISRNSQRRRRTNTLFSSGALDKPNSKSNEYFGGDSTVFLGSDEKNSK